VDHIARRQRRIDFGYQQKLPWCLALTLDVDVDRFIEGQPLHAD